LKILFVGETWQGSFARSLRETLEPMPGVEVDDVGEDHFSPRARSRLVRGVTRLLGPWYRQELHHAIVTAVAARRPDVLMVYKGAQVSAETILQARRARILTVNVFPDYSPHAYGARLKAAIGEYDLVVSTKPFHPAVWASTYGYRNRCVFVPHGYDPNVHYWPEPPAAQDFDVVLAATWRPEYHALMQQLAASLAGHALRVGIIGSGWAAHQAALPSDWIVAPSLHGRSYGDWLRRGRIVVAPVNREVVIDGVRQPGDEDTTRTYELAAMGCFFLHRRTPYAQSAYDEHAEVPMWETPEELAELVLRFLPLAAERRQMAARAHARAVPAYSLAHRATQILDEVNDAMRARTGGGG